MKFISASLLILLYSSLSAQENTLILETEMGKIERLSNDTVAKGDKPSILHKDFFNYKADSLNFETVVGLEEEKDPNIDLLIEDYMQHKKFMGYRIQVFSSNERWEAVKARSEFLKKYPYEKSYLIYQAPNFKVRIGDYEDLLNAHQHIESIKIDFPMAFIIKDEIEPSVEKN